MKKLIRTASVVGLLCGGAVLLAGCYESDGSIVSDYESIMPLKTGHYCQYDFLDEQRTWDTTCHDVTIASPSANTYVVTDSDASTVYTVHIDGKPLESGDLAGNYITEACWDDATDGKGCYVGTIKVFDNQTFHWVYPACSSPDDGAAAADPCRIDSEATARSEFLNAARWSTDDLRKYVWQAAL